MKVVSFLCFTCFSLALFATSATPDSISFYMQDGQRIIIYEVDEGETLYSISKAYSASIDDILALNPSIKDRQVRKGQIIKIPATKQKETQPGENTGRFSMHTVQKGQTLYAISREYGVPVEKIIGANKGLKPDDLKSGQQIRIPETAKSGDEEQSGSSEDNRDKTDDKKDNKKDNKRKYSFPTKPGKKEKEKYRYHEVTPGETVYGISRKYDVMVTDLMDWNHLENFNIDVGQRLIVGMKSAGRGDGGKEREKASQQDEDQDRESSAEKADTTGEFFASDNDDAMADREKQKTSPARQDEPDEKPAPEDTVTENSEKDKEGGRDRRRKRNDNYEPRETLISLEYKEHLSSKGYKELTEKSIARWMKNVDGYPVKNGYFALHKTLPIGTIIKVTNPVNQRIVFAKVIGHLPGGGNTKDIHVKLPEAAAKELKAFDDTSMLQISYLQEQNGH